MSYSPAVSVILTIVFAVTGTGYLLRVVRGSGSGDGIGRMSDVMHVVMSMAMLAVPWSWGMTYLPPGLQMLVFGLATAFYLALFVAGPVSAEATDHHAGRATLAYHVVMMGSMIVMAVMMSGMGSGGSMSMPGMDMSGGATDMGGATSWTRVASVVFAVVLAAGALWQLVRLVRPAHEHSGARVDAALLLVMSAGMALAFAQS